MAVRVARVFVEKSSSWNIKMTARRITFAVQDSTFCANLTKAMKVEKTARGKFELPLATGKELQSVLPMCSIKRTIRSIVSRLTSKNGLKVRKDISKAKVLNEYLATEHRKDGVSK